MKNILIPTDFSKNSILAVKAGAKIAKKYNYKIILVHLLELPQGYFTNQQNSFSTMMRVKYIEERFKKVIMAPFLNGVKIDFIIKHYAVFSEISKIAKEHSSSLIIMGAHSKEININYVGTNTTEVVNHSQIPVLIIKSELDIINFDSPLFVSDFKLENANAYKKLKTFFDEISVTPKLLFVNLPDNGFVSSVDMKNRLIQFLMLTEGHVNNLCNFVNYDDYNVEDGAINFAKENKSTLIAMATHGTTAVSSLFHRNTSLELTHKSTIPTLTALA